MCGNGERTKTALHRALTRHYVVAAGEADAIRSRRMRSNGGYLIAQVALSDVTDAVGSAGRVNGYDLKARRGHGSAGSCGHGYMMV